jgi:hypothetical protein
MFLVDNFFSPFFDRIWRNKRTSNKRSILQKNECSAHLKNVDNPFHPPWISWGLLHIHPQLIHQKTGEKRERSAGTFLLLLADT